eukprot:COSAG01_NODE_1664_length_9573_cov_31.637429_11_plen_132_part_00
MRQHKEEGEEGEPIDAVRTYAALRTIGKLVVSAPDPPSMPPPPPPPDRRPQARHLSRTHLAIWLPPLDSGPLPPAAPLHQAAQLTPPAWLGTVRACGLLGGATVPHGREQHHHLAAGCSRGWHSTRSPRFS